ncbi:TrkH family potassium uptake protein [Plectonema radiosum NIES-515]|uniref:TrkH family potassium uptake protein n=1 Tax=Plectonema radiosum NIES-515 TaxID=2986073 RepID=A0ABT3AV30_9CYAN|nr:TrkH family potassium uptake protein [Plectonema radiosum]MCV3212982.1 TrkH family potassium uptake protein [Plectonema radiosum NIES-515]
MTVARTICLGFLAVIAVGTILLMMPFSTSNGTWNDLIVALFTSTSAVCVTGLSVVDIGTYFSFWGQLLILVLMQIGGLGYMTATTFLLLLLGRKFNLRDKVALQQALDNRGIHGGAQLVRSIIATTLIFEITGVFLILPVFVPDYGFYQGLWLSIFHSVSAWTNGSFSLLKDSFIHYQSSVLLNLVISGLIIFGGIGYEVILEFYLWVGDRKNKKPGRFLFSLNFKVATSTALMLLMIGTIAFVLAEYKNHATFGSLSFGNKLMAAFFLSVSTRTSGFNTIDIGKMNQASLFIAIALMFIGGSPGSMAGGIKTTTLRVLTSCTKTILQGKEQVLMYRRQIPISLILKAVGVAVGSLGAVMLATILIALTDLELSFLQILFEVVSAFATVGLSTGITAILSAPAKLILVFTMYIGRVGVLLFISALTGDSSPSSIEYPEDNLLVG